jgi:predicted nucleotidyltransferase
MNVIRDDFPPKLKKFFVNLENYLDTDLYFYGSVNRSDYVHGKSDIDIAIFTDNENSIMSKLQHYLHTPKKAFSKIVRKLKGTIIYGYKIKCEKYVDSNCEISIYNNDFKDIVLQDIRSGMVIPYHLAILVFILKTLYYTIPILTKKTYTNYKNYIFNKLIKDKGDNVFFVIKQDKKIENNYIQKN